MCIYSEILSYFVYSMFTITLTDECNLAVIKPYYIKDQTYYLGKGQMSIEFNYWSVSKDVCEPFTYNST